VRTIRGPEIAKVAATSTAQPPPVAERQHHRQQTEQRRLEHHRERQHAARDERAFPPQPRCQHERQEQQIDLPALEVKIERKEEGSRDDHRGAVGAPAAGTQRHHPCGQQPPADRGPREADLREAIRHEGEETEQVGRERRIEEPTVTEKGDPVAQAGRDVRPAVVHVRIQAQPARLAGDPVGGEILLQRRDRERHPRRRHGGDRQPDDDGVALRRHRRYRVRPNVPSVAWSPASSATSASRLVRSRPMVATASVLPARR
jgi:hypothetical protein